MEGIRLLEDDRMTGVRVGDQFLVGCGQPLEPVVGKVSAAGRLKGSIRLEGVSFRYGPLAPYAVRDV